MEQGMNNAFQNFNQTIHLNYCQNERPANRTVDTLFESVTF